MCSCRTRSRSSARKHGAVAFDAHPTSANRARCDRAHNSPDGFARFRKGSTSNMPSPACWPKYQRIVDRSADEFMYREDGSRSTSRANSGFATASPGRRLHTRHESGSAARSSHRRNHSQPARQREAARDEIASQRRAGQVDMADRRRDPAGFGDGYDFSNSNGAAAPSWTRPAARC
jgi:hypothetical protein